MPADPAGDAFATPVPAPDHALRAVTVPQERGPARCTLFPDDADDAARVTTWLSADADALVALGEMR